MESELEMKLPMPIEKRNKQIAELNDIIINVILDNRDNSVDIKSSIIDKISNAIMDSKFEKVEADEIIMSIDAMTTDYVSTYFYNTQVFNLVTKIKELQDELAKKEKLNEN